MNRDIVGRRWAEGVSAAVQEVLADAYEQGARFVVYRRNDDGSLEKISAKRSIRENASSYVLNSIA